MNERPLCRNCMVVLAVRLLQNEYTSFRMYLEAAKIEGLPDHARGYCQGQLSLTRDLLASLSAVLPYLEAEVALRAARKKE